MSVQERVMTEQELLAFVEDEHYQEICMDYYGVGNEAVREDIRKGYMAYYAGSMVVDGYVVLNQAA